MNEETNKADKQVLRKQANWKGLYFYQKSNVLYQLTFALSLFHMVGKMMTTYQKQPDETFISEGGIKERMTAARLGYRTNQKEEIARLK